MKMEKYYIFLALGALAIALMAVFVSIGPDDKSFPAAVTMPAMEKSLGNMAEMQNDSREEENGIILLLPDLQVKKLSGARIDISPDGRKILRFPGTFTNTGDGPLEVVGSLDEKTGTTMAIQQIYYMDGTKDEKFVGSFIFHEDHSHWHFENFVEFGIYTLKDGAEPDQKIASTGKMTFCIHDYAPLSEDFPGKPTAAVYPWCDNSPYIQGISVGWEDTYNADVPGQEIDITRLNDGTYAFIATVDPENRLEEKIEDNNSAVSFIHISGNAISVLPEHQP